MPTNQAELLRMETQSSWVSLFPGVSSLPRGSSCSGLFPGVGSGGFAGRVVVVVVVAGLVLIDLRK